MHTILKAVVAGFDLERREHRFIDEAIGAFDGSYGSLDYASFIVRYVNDRWVKWYNSIRWN